MKKYSQSLFAALLLLLSSMAAKALDPGVSCAVFATPDQCYLEINIEIAGPSVTFVKADETHLQAGVEVLLLVKQGEKVVNYEKYSLKSPLVVAAEDLLDVKRFMLEPGEYTVDVSFQDENNPENKKQVSRNIKVEKSAGVYLSDIQLLRGYREDNSTNPFVKNGYFLEPLPFAFYDRNATTLSFYTEIYHADQSIAQGAQYQVRYFIEQDKGNGVKELAAAGAQRKKAGPIDAVLVQLDISQLASGNYDLTVEVRDATAGLLTSRKIDFQRSNPFLDFKDEEITEAVLEKQFVSEMDYEALRLCMRALNASAEGNEGTTILSIVNSGDEKGMRFHIFRHFVKMDPNNPEIAYRKYMETAAAANNRFKSGFRYGFETDRGRTYMRFGRPDDVVHVEDEPGAFPYEIWIYYNFPKTNQKNVKFLFYNPSLAGEDYITLHTNMRGGIANPKWERELYRRAPSEFLDDNFGDAENVTRNFGRNARAYFDDY